MRSNESETKVDTVNVKALQSLEFRYIGKNRFVGDWDRAPHVQEYTKRECGWGRESWSNAADLLVKENGKLSVQWNSPS